MPARKSGKRISRIQKKRKQRVGKRQKNKGKRNKNRPLEAAAPTYNEGFESGHTEGYGAGYKSARDAAYQEGYQAGVSEGRYEGGDSIVDRLLPGDHILPDTPLEQIIAAGIAVMGERVVQLITVNQVGDQIIQALEERKPLSLIRLGDGELLTLAQEKTMTIEQVRQEGSFLSYAGVQVPDLAVRDQLYEAVKRADIVGIPKLRKPSYQPLAAAVFAAYGMDIRGRAFTDSLVNYSLFKSGYLMRILQGRRVLVIGNMADSLAAILASKGIAIAGIISPVHGAHDAARVAQAAALLDFDIAIVSAGIAAVLIVEEIARTMGKVAIDFGHMADSIVKGEAAF